MTLWDYAVALYARVDVERACLDLQDTDGQCIPLLLWRLWTIDQGRAVDDETIRRAVALARSWDGAVVSPLRSIRRGLKAAFPPIAEAARGALRNQVAAVELAAERVLLETLDALTPCLGRGEIDGPAALHAVTAEWGAPASHESLRRLVLAASAPTPLADSRWSVTP